MFYCMFYFTRDRSLSLSTTTAANPVDRAPTLVLFQRRDVNCDRFNHITIAIISSVRVYSAAGMREDGVPPLFVEPGNGHPSATNVVLVVSTKAFSFQNRPSSHFAYT